MSDAQSAAARSRFQRDAVEICAACAGTGLAVSESESSRAKAGGNHSFVKSLQPGEMSMSERGRLGGRPKGPVLADLIGRDRDTGTVSPKELAPESTVFGAPIPVY